ncbi:MAG: PKD-like family lipoprotein [Candidatus Pseudobacter hemicellulosilyticus]|uniref:PKD-like family lipoprotein n=1 Tax=Candidatus Pseudobacter hemicellulosilyticus TaxID=3121375 RepID=A0AAJ6BIB0_9BACT|nr:MAG: PKD-like family lipoprotein [Pseudobacter sp.]
MKQLTYTLLLLLTGVVLAVSCSKDKGNYAYTPINDLTITTVADTFYVTQLDTLDIQPVITGMDPNRVRYEWRVSPIIDPAQPLTQGEIRIISRERNLHEQITLPAGSLYFFLDYVVTDTVTGVSYFKKMRFQVITDFQKGWMLLEQKAGGADMSFITPGDVIFRNVYSSTNADKPLPASAHKLISTDAGGLLGILNMVYYDGGGYVLNNNSLAVTGGYESVFFSPPAVVQPQNLLKPSAFSWGPYTFSDGKVYAVNGIFGSKLFGTAFSQPDNKGYKVAPFVAGGLAFGGIVFDQLNHRFLYDGGSTSTSLKTFPANTGLAFELSNVQKKMLTMKAGLGHILFPTNFYAIFKNENNDDCFLYTINADGNMNTSPVAEAQQAILNSPDVHRSPDYLFSNSIRQMYYAADNKLYVYDMAANRSRVVYEFAGGENITSLQLDNNTNTITLSTYNGSAGGGTVYFLPLAGTGDILNNTYSKKFSGFEKIVHLVQKIG